MKKYFLLLALCSVLKPAIAQDELTTEEIKSRRGSHTDPSAITLTVGDPVPEVKLGKFVSGKESSSFSELKDKLVILDFMDTYCVSCIENLPKLDSLQRKFANDVLIYPVTWQEKNFVKKWIERPDGWMKRFNIELDWIVEDSVLSNIFKHKLVSHFVWIKSGEVKAITHKDYVTEENIHSVLRGEKNNWPVKIDEEEYDLSIPILQYTNLRSFSNNPTFVSYSGMAGFKEGIDIGGIRYDSLQRRSYFYNFSILRVYNALWSMLNAPEVEFYLHPDRTVLEVENPFRYTPDPTDYLSPTPPDGYITNWNLQNRFSYEMVTAEELPEKERISRIISDLDNKLGLITGFEKRKTKVLVLVRTDPHKTPDTTKQGGAKIRVGAIPLICLNLSQKYPFAIDETGYEGSIILPPMDGSLGNLRAELQKQGFDILEAEREIEVLVIKEKKLKL